MSINSDSDLDAEVIQGYRESSPDYDELPDPGQGRASSQAEDSDGSSCRSTGGKTILVAAVYEEEWFVAEKVADVKPGMVKLSYMTPRGHNVFMWPDKPDIMDTVKEDILVENISIEPVNSRGYFRVKNTDYKRVKQQMVVVYFFLIY